jgi:hypothetical protein
MTFLTTLTPITSTQNSTNTPLGISAIWTGSSENVLRYTGITVSLKSDTSGSISFEFSSDGTNWDSVRSENISANKDYSFPLEVTNNNFRVVYTNGSVAQTFFRLNTIYSPYKPTSNTLEQRLENGIKLDATLLDEFLRVKTASPFTLFDSKLLTRDNETKWDTLTTGTASGALDPNGSFYVMSVATTGDRIVRQSRRYCNYQPGKSLEILVTGVLKTSGTEANYISKIGYFDDVNDKTQETNPQGNGFFFEWDGSVVNIVERTSVTGSQVDTKVAQSSWNIDPMDGTGPSGITVDWSTRQILNIGLEWLGVGEVTLGMVINREIHPVHRFLHANGQGNNIQKPYINRPSLPVRYELEAIGPTPATMNQICCTVNSNGGFRPTGDVYGANSGIIPKTVNAEVPILSLRLKASSRRDTLNTIAANLSCSTNGFILFRVYRFLSPTTDPLTGSSWTSVNAQSSAEYDSSATAVSFAQQNILVASGYFDSRAAVGESQLRDRVFVTSNIEGYSDIIVITGESVGANESVFCACEFQEIN